MGSEGRGIYISLTSASTIAPTHRHQYQLETLLPAFLQITPSFHKQESQKKRE